MNSGVRHKCNKSLHTGAMTALPPPLAVPPFDTGVFTAGRRAFATSDTTPENEKDHDGDVEYAAKLLP